MAQSTMILPFSRRHFLLHDPIRDVMRSTIKINPDLGYRKARQGKTLAIVLEIDLLHRHRAF